MEQTSINRISQLHPLIRLKALAAYNEAVAKTPKGVHPFITETYRSFERSTALYNQPRDGKDNDGDGKIDEPDEKVSNAKAGQSLHNYGLALDFMLIINGKDSWVVDKNWKLVADIFKKHGFVWGGDWKSFKDYPHVELTLGNTWQTCLAKWNKGDTFVDANGLKYVNL